ncbi:hypothetical protein NEOLEDRAFT_1133202 [Neolentinus lepideus HHB14362 ss-1]|uniref:Uncharacterized protein n=1 Tax=Neolentinus lepideus HHB14362 ss-1 TaxID=1314782 RepID=A0A165SUF1_9AGAM|nr:hypothetical protein NEOLEDRAFT_1133202 [Neolentinus lepideus HHB14362 ss-1]
MTAPYSFPDHSVSGLLKESRKFRAKFVISEWHRSFGTLLANPHCQGSLQMHICTARE